jgi:hypothetical protein
MQVLLITEIMIGRNSVNMIPTRTSSGVLVLMWDLGPIERKL